MIGAARAPLLGVVEISAGPCGGKVPPTFLLLRLACIGWSKGPAGRGVGGARSSPYLCLIVKWASGGPAPPRGLAGFFVVAVGGVRAVCAFARSCRGFCF